MFIGASEGHAFRYEVIEDGEGVLVRMRDLATGAVEEDETRMYRTAAVAFAYAELSAAFDRYAAARIARDESARVPPGRGLGYRREADRAGRLQRRPEAGGAV